MAGPCRCPRCEGEPPDDWDDEDEDDEPVDDGPDYEPDVTYDDGGGW